MATRSVNDCRSCGAALRQSVVDLGLQPLANAFPGPDDLGRPDPAYPLHPYVCSSCWLMQLHHRVSPEEIFADYAYFSSFSDSWLEHAAAYAERMIGELELGPSSQVVEVASNDGYLLRNFVESGHPRSRNRAGTKRRRSGGGERRSDRRPVPRPDDGRATARRRPSSGSADREQRSRARPGPQRLRRRPGRPARAAGDVDHGVSAPAPSARGGAVRHDLPRALLLLLAGGRTRRLRAPRARSRGRRGARDPWRLAARVRTSRGRRCGSGPLGRRARARRADHGLSEPAVFRRLGSQAARVKEDLLAFLADARADGKRVVAYGAPAKGNTLLNYVGADTRSIEYTVDRSPYKQGLFLPGSRLPIHAPEQHPRRPARLRPAAAVEPARRDRGADVRSPRVGRQVRRADPAADRVLRIRRRRTSRTRRPARASRRPCASRAEASAGAPPPSPCS